MLKVTTVNRMDHLNAIELCDDYKRKMNVATSTSFVDHAQDSDGCATLIVHCVGPGSQESDSLAHFLAQLKRVTAEVEALIQPAAPVTEAAQPDGDASEQKSSKRAARNSG